MKNIILFVLFLFSILLTVYLWNQNQKKKAGENQEEGVQTDSIKLQEPATRILDKGEFARLIEIEKYADSVTWQLIPTGNMELSPGFENVDDDYFATDFRAAFQSGAPLFAIHSLRDAENPDFFQKTLILKDGKVVQVESQYDIGKGSFSLGRRFDYYDKNGNNIGTKTMEIFPNEAADKLDTLINTFQVLDKTHLTLINPNDLMREILDASYGRADYALIFNGIRKDSSAYHIMTKTFNGEWQANFKVENEDETFVKLKNDPAKYKGKIIKIDMGFGYDFEKKGRRNHYNGGTVIE